MMSPSRGDIPPNQPKTLLASLASQPRPLQSKVPYQAPQESGKLLSNQQKLAPSCHFEGLPSLGIVKGVLLYATLLETEKYKKTTRAIPKSLVLYRSTFI